MGRPGLLLYRHAISFGRHLTATDEMAVRVDWAGVGPSLWCGGAGGVEAAVTGFFFWCQSPDCSSNRHADGSGDRRSAGSGTWRGPGRAAGSTCRRVGAGGAGGRQSRRQAQSRQRASARGEGSGGRTRVGHRAAQGRRKAAAKGPEHVLKKGSGRRGPEHVFAKGQRAVRGGGRRGETRVGTLEVRPSSIRLPGRSVSASRPGTDSTSM